MEARKGRPAQGAPQKTTPEQPSSRRLRLHETLKKRRRISNALDVLCGVDRGRAPMPYGSSGMGMDWRQRERAGQAWTR